MLIFFSAHLNVPPHECSFIRYIRKNHMESSIVNASTIKLYTHLFILSWHEAETFMTVVQPVLFRYFSAFRI